MVDARCGAIGAASPSLRHVGTPEPRGAGYRLVRILFVGIAMSPRGTLESLVNEARRAALAGGLLRITRMHFRLGPDSELRGEELRSLLVASFHGPLLERCGVTWERAGEGGVTLASIEGIVEEPEFAR